MTANISSRDVELELRIGRVELILGIVIDGSGVESLETFWEDTKVDILSVFPESRVGG